VKVLNFKSDLRSYPGPHIKQSYTGNRGCTYDCLMVTQITLVPQGLQRAGRAWAVTAAKLLQLVQYSKQVCRCFVSGALVGTVVLLVVYLYSGTTGTRCPPGHCMPMGNFVVHGFMTTAVVFI
jgi:hypothetical protein